MGQQKFLASLASLEGRGHVGSLDNSDQPVLFAVVLTFAHITYTVFQLIIEKAGSFLCEVVILHV